MSLMLFSQIFVLLYEPRSLFVGEMERSVEERDRRDKKRGDARTSSSSVRLVAVSRRKSSLFRMRVVDPLAFQQNI